MKTLHSQIYFKPAHIINKKIEKRQYPKFDRTPPVRLISQPVWNQVRNQIESQIQENIKYENNHVLRPTTSGKIF